MHRKSNFHYLALAGVLAIALFFRLYNIGAERYGNLYYASTVYSMLGNWKNFFFASFDPAGYVTVDKPPLGFWVQSLSAAIFGFEGWALILPQVLAGTLSCLVLYWLVRRFYGPNAGLLAALILAVTPIAVATDRNNTMDAQLVLALLLSASALLLAVEKGSLKWLLLGAALIGLGFNIKMLQAYMVLPAFYGLYFLAARLSWRRKLLHLGLASLVLGVISFAWVMAVDLVPAELRPYIGSSQDNTVANLITGHNGASRLGSIMTWFGMESTQRQSANRQFPPDGPQPPNQPGTNRAAGLPPVNPNNQRPSNNFQPPAQGQGPALPQPPGGQFPPGQNAQGQGPTGGPMGPGETGQPGPFRLFTPQLAGQVTWLLPLALVLMVALFIRQKLSWPLGADAQFALFWGLWLVPMIVFFSFAGLFHRYYLEMLAPAVAALVAGGLSALAADFEQKRGGWLLPLALGGSAIFETAILLVYWPTWNSWLIPATLILGLAAAIGLVFTRRATNPVPNAACLLLGVALVGLLLAPVVWATTPLINGGDVALPYAGPELTQRGGGSDLSAYESLAEYLVENAGNEAFIVAAQNANLVAPLILLTGQPAMAIGGFSGSDPILTADDFAAYVKNGTLRYVLVAPDNRGGQGINQWVQNTCQLVPDNAWKGSTSQPTNQAPAGRGGVARLALYDCQ